MADAGNHHRLHHPRAHLRVVRLTERVEFAYQVFKGLAVEATRDPELLVLTAAGLGLASPSRPLRGIGIAMAGWYVTRRVDAYVTALDSKMQLIASVMDAGNLKEANERISDGPESRTPPR